jgi:hypothetical protein
MDPQQPFSLVSIAYYSRTLFMVDNGGSWLAGLVAMLMNHCLSAPQIWRGLAIIVVFLVIVDFILGVARCLVVADIFKKTKGADYPLPKGLSFNSRDMGSTLIKMLVYGVLFILFMGIDMGVAIAFGRPYTDAFFLSGLAMAAIAGRELTSVFENAKDILKCIKEPWVFECTETIANKIILMLGRKAQEAVGEIVDAAAEKQKEADKHAVNVAEHVEIVAGHEAKHVETVAGHEAEHVETVAAQAAQALKDVATQTAADLKKTAENE